MNLISLLGIPPLVLPNEFIASNGFIYAFQSSTFVGQAIIAALIFVSIVSWTVMFTKFNQVRAAEKTSQDFLRTLRAEDQFVSLFKKGRTWNNSPLSDLYVEGCKGLQGSAGLNDKTKIDLLEASLERAVAEQVVRLESQISILGTAVGTAPFLGLLGTVWGVMDAFSAVASAGSASIGTLAPGISAALITTVIGLVVALPSMVGYNILVARIRNLTMGMENFASEFLSIVRKEMGS
jgi:biopolymer transport protein TolQ